MLRTVNIPIPIFDDGFAPATCARRFDQLEGVCPQLLTSRFGTAMSCKLFSTEFGKRASGEKRIDYPKGIGNPCFLVPCEECLALRKENGLTFKTEFTVEDGKVKLEKVC